MSAFLITKFSVFHNFALPLEFGINLSKELFNKLHENKDVINILSTKKEEDKAFEYSNNNTSSDYCNSIKDYFKINQMLFSPYYFHVERNFRLIMKGPKLESSSGLELDVKLNILIDKRGIVIMNFFIEYEFQDGIDSSQVIHELFDPHDNKVLVVNSDDKTKKNLNFQEVAKFYHEKITGMLKGSEIPKDSELMIPNEEMLDKFYEPYAFTIIDKYSGSIFKENEVDPQLKDKPNQKVKKEQSEEVKNDILRILLWDKHKHFETFNTKGLSNFFKDASRKDGQFTFFSTESTLLFMNSHEKIDISDVVYALVNIEVLLIQKVVLQMYDYLVDKNFQKLREKRISMNSIIRIKNAVMRDLDEFFDIRTKKYQRGREISDAGKDILNLKDYYDEVNRKTDALGDAITLRHNRHVEIITNLVAIISIIAASGLALIQIQQLTDYRFWICIGMIVGVGTAFGIFKIYDMPRIRSKSSS